MCSTFSICADRAAAIDVDEAAKALPLLRLRIAETTSSRAVEHVVMQPIADDLAAALFLDLPLTVQSVAASRVEAWGRPLDEVFELARAQTRREVVEVSSIDAIAGWIITGESFFSATAALWVDELVDLPPRGALLALPSRHLVFVAPIHDAGIIPRVSDLAQLTDRAYHRGPGSISPHL